MPPTIAVFAVATLMPVPFLILGAAFGGIWALLAFLAMTGLVFALDALVDYAAPVAPEGSEFPATDQLSIGLAAGHFVLLLLAIWALSGGTGIGWLARLPLFLAFGMYFGQVSNSNAHELIHRSDKRLFRLGMWVYISLLFGHHTSAHRHVHHRFVATEDDPNSADAGESFYAFAERAWIGSFAAGREMESALRQQAGKSGLHPYTIYLAGGAVCLIFVTLVFGLEGLVAYLLIAAYAQLQLLLSDYVQHYGLLRARLPGDRAEPVGDRHSWNAPHWFSGALMLNAPRHSAHHARPRRPYPELTLPPEGRAPMLPYSLPMMAAIALYPKLWFRIMDPRLTRWRIGPEPF